MKNISPDIEFKKAIKKNSGSSLNECMQCGNCSAVCTLAPADKPFPRKEMIWTTWGLKDKLIASVDVWMCHQCGDCSTYCPRGVKPADVLSAIRNQVYKEYSRPSIVGKLVSKPELLPVAILIPVAVISAILILAGTLTIPEGPVNYARFFPHAWLNSSFTLITLLFYGSATRGVIQFYNDLKAQFPGIKPKINFWKSLFLKLKEVLMHTKFGECNSNRSKRIAHFLMFYGFILLLFVTLYAIIAAITHNYPLKMTNPFKIAGNLASVMLLTGLSIFIVGRLFNKKEVGNSNYSDWLLLVSILLLTISGIIVQFARFGNWDLAYHFYFFHLVCVWFVIIYLPFTKFAHMIYRLVALSFAASIGRK